MPQLVLTLALLAAPLSALAQDAGCERDEALSCAEGTTYDADAKACVPIVS